LNDGGSIILTGSVASVKGTSAFGVYAASKAAIIGATHAPEQPPRLYSGGLCPLVHQAINPSRDRDGLDVTRFSAQVHDCPMPLALLQIAERQLGEFMPTESAGQQNGKQSAISFALRPFPVWRLPQRLSLFRGQPVAESDSQLLDAFDAPYPRSQVAAEETAV
jgi:hypothetical protein